MPETYSLTSKIALNDGNSYPRFGLGAHLTHNGRVLLLRWTNKNDLPGVYVTEPGEETYNAVTWALEVRTIPESTLLACPQSCSLCRAPAPCTRGDPLPPDRKATKPAVPFRALS